MEDADRFRLIGKYRTLRFRIGQRVRCQVRGEMVIRGMTAAPIPWPLGSLKGRGGRHSLIVYKDLAKAVRRESELAICHWFGVCPLAVRKWHRALGVGFATDETSQLFREYISEFGDAMRALGVLKARDPERRRKIAEARRCKPRPAHVGEAVR